MLKRIHIIIVDPSAIIRCGVEAMLQRSQLFSCDVALMSEITALTTSANKSVPDILIVNPSQLGLFSPSQLKADIGNDNLKIVALQSTFADSSLLQNYDESISIVESEENIINKISSVAQIGDEAEVKKELSAREKEIIVCVVKGLTNKQIADSLCLSTHTVIAHRRNISNKLQIFSPSGLTIYAIVNKLVDLADIKNSIYKGGE